MPFLLRVAGVRDSETKRSIISQLIHCSYDGPKAATCNEPRHLPWPNHAVLLSWSVPQSTQSNRLSLIGRQGHDAPARVGNTRSSPLNSSTAAWMDDAEISMRISNCSGASGFGLGGRSFSFTQISSTMSVPFLDTVRNMRLHSVKLISASHLNPNAKSESQFRSQWLSHASRQGSTLDHDSSGV